MSALMFIVHLGATLAMTGVIWMVQIVQYPLFDAVGREAFASYHSGHTRLISLVVMPLMLTELATAGWLCFQTPSGVPSFAPWVGLALVLLAWGSTAFLQVPQHGLLHEGFSSAAHQALVSTNWIRTFAWTARSGLWLTVTAQLITR